jgi:hypothetical protein
MMLTQKLPGWILWLAATPMAVLAAQDTEHAATAAPTVLDSSAIERAAGLPGKMDNGVFKITVPRRDLAISAAGVKLSPAMGLSSWAAFTRAGDHTMMMGDLTLREEQVNPVMSVALDNGLR